MANINKKPEETFTKGPIPLNQALLNVYPGDVYQWVGGSEGGTGTVVSREFFYNTGNGEVAVSFRIREDGKTSVNGTMKKVVSKNSTAAPVADAFYFTVQVGDAVQHTDLWNSFDVVGKKVIFDASNDTATVELKVNWTNWQTEK
ncbi:hypothetical protein [Pseudomonas graminis]|jgi:hypothetical protein|uniref:Uncharacterized protein n=1 Tax=Pseudomonas graminis TaxID=158627 RepID=A0A6M8MJ80_9PSED|nr:hypothetical protein [Pseudomonas graminis]QKF50243.1 hypothetical protein FX982_01180 [Pseudomonas graminis]